MNAQYSMHQLEVAFATRRRMMQEPFYRSIARQYCFECGLDTSVVPPVHLREQTRTVLGLLDGGRCRLGDMFKLGLTLPIALRDPRDAVFLVERVLRAAVMAKEQLPWRVTFEMLVRAGVTPAVFAATPRSFLDLALIEFSMPVFLAAGGTPRQLRAMTLNLAANPVTLLSQFEMAAPMQQHIVATLQMPE